MIISASYKTDIPAFYGEWFRNRLRAGFCRMVNPYNKKQHLLISLRSTDVDGFIFWTKNLSPFVENLEEVHQMGFPFVVQHTINGYPRSLESRVVDSDRSLRNFCQASEKYGTEAMVWRYDPIILSTVTDYQFHTQNFSSLAQNLKGATREVVVSFMQVYRKTRSNLNIAASENGFEWSDPTLDEKRALLSSYVEIASKNHIRVSICTQPELMVSGADHATCVDSQRLMKLSGKGFQTRIKGMRKGCGCYQSRDIGDYDTCPHGCVYCYAVQNRSLALTRYQEHDPLGEYLFPPKHYPEVGTELPGEEPSTTTTGYRVG